MKKTFFYFQREFAGKNPGDIMQQCKQLLPLPSLSHGVFTVSPVKETPGIPGQAADKLPSGGGTNSQVMFITVLLWQCIYEGNHTYERHVNE